MFHGSREAIIEQLLREEPLEELSKMQRTSTVDKGITRETTQKTMYEVQNFSNPLLLYRLTNASN